MTRLSLKLAFFVTLLCHVGIVQAACWRSTLEGSHVRFAIQQAGSTFQGTFKRFEGKVCLDQGNPSNDKIAVTVETSSVDTQLPEADEALKGSDFLDASQWPLASFASKSIKELGGDRYSADGVLTVRNTAREVTVSFELNELSSRTMKATGQFSILRLDYGIGQGEWRDTRNIANEVDIDFAAILVLQPGSPDIH